MINFRPEAGSGAFWPAHIGAEGRISGIQIMYQRGTSLSGSKVHQSQCSLIKPQRTTETVIPSIPGCVQIGCTSSPRYLVRFLLEHMVLVSKITLLHGVARTNAGSSILIRLELGVGC